MNFGSFDFGTKRREEMMETAGAVFLKNVRYHDVCY